MALRQLKLMKIQVFEQFAGGHHTNYIQELLPELSELVSSNLVDEVVVTTSQKNYSLLQSQEDLSDYSKFINFDTSLPEVMSGTSLRQRREFAENVINAVQRVNPNYLISISADYESLFFAFKEFFQRQTLPKILHSSGIFHYGYSGALSDLSDYAKQLIYSLTWRYSPWSRLLMVNPLIYEAIKHQSDSFSKRVGLVPNPVHSSVYFDKETARKILNIPTDGRYIGFIGRMDNRKAIPELLAAFKDAELAPTDYLLLLGKLEPEYKQLIESQFADLLSKNRLILLDRHLTVNELSAGFCALDVAAILQYKRPNLSCNLLQAIAARRPVITNNYGYTGMIAERFDVGWSCDMSDHQALVSTLKRGLDESETYVVSPKTERLIQFHHPSNYANTVLLGLKDLLGLDSLNQVKSWEWVFDPDNSGKVNN